MWGLVILVSIVIIYLGWLYANSIKPVVVHIPEKTPDENIAKLGALPTPYGSVSDIIKVTPLTDPVVNNPTWIFQLDKTGAYARSHSMKYRDWEDNVKTMWLSNYGVMEINNGKANYEEVKIWYKDAEDDQMRWASVGSDGRWRIHSNSNTFLWPRTYIHVWNENRVKQRIDIVEMTRSQPNLPPIPPMPSPPPKITPDPNYEFMLHGFKNVRAGSFKFIAPDGSTKVAFLAEGPELIVADEQLSKIEYRGRIDIKPPHATTDPGNSKLITPYTNMPDSYTVKLYLDTSGIVSFLVCCSNQSGIPIIIPTDPPNSFRTNVMYYYPPGLTIPGMGVGLSIQKKNAPELVPPLSIKWK